MKLRPYQLEAVEFGHQRELWIYADPPGTGKTLTAAQWALGGDTTARVLVVAPLSVLGQWRTEIERLGYPGRVEVGHGPKRNDVLVDLVGLSGRAHPGVYITNYESLRRDMLHLTSWDAVIFDEAHRVSRGSQIAAAANRIKAPRKAMVSATPIVNQADELWQYLHMLYPHTFTSYWKWVEDHHTVKLRSFGGRPPFREVGPLRPGHEKIVRDALSRTLIQRPLRELMPHLPVLTEIRLPVTLTPNEQKAYDKIVEHYWANVEGTLVEATNAAVANLRLRQISSDWSTLAQVGKLGAKSAVTVDQVADLVRAGRQVVVFVAFTATGEAVASAVERATKRQVARYWGNADRRLDLFTGGQAPVIVGTYGAMSEGIDGMQAVSSDLVLHDLPWTPKEQTQAVGRLLRSGQTRPVNVWMPHIPGTVDDDVLAALERKEAYVAGVTGRKTREAMT